MCDPLGDTAEEDEPHAREPVGPQHSDIHLPLLQKGQDLGRDMTVHDDQLMSHLVRNPLPVFIGHPPLDPGDEGALILIRIDWRRIRKHRIDHRRHNMEKVELGAILLCHFKCGFKGSVRVFRKIDAAGNSLDRHISYSFSSTIRVLSTSSFPTTPTRTPFSTTGRV